MPGDRIFNFNGANVTFNDIHDNNNCTIITGGNEKTVDENPETDEPAASLCEYILKNEFKPMPEIEKELAAAAKKSSKAMAQYVMRGARLGTLDLHGDDGKTVFSNLQEHFGFTWKYSAWMTYYCTKL